MIVEREQEAPNERISDLFSIVLAMNARWPSDNGSMSINLRGSDDHTVGSRIASVNNVLRWKEQPKISAESLAHR